MELLISKCSSTTFLTMCYSLLSVDGSHIYDKDDPEQVTIESVEFDDSSVELFVEEQELERVDFATEQPASRIRLGTTG